LIETIDSNGRMKRVYNPLGGECGGNHSPSNLVAHIHIHKHIHKHSRQQLESMTTTPETTDTRERLLEAGLEVFAERGFHDASLRKICAHAGANSAAVNYYFGNKQRFYAEVLVTSHQRAVRRRPMPRLADDPKNPGVMLYHWLRWFLELLLVESASSPLGQLMAREMFAPTEAIEELVRRSILPMYRALGEIVGALTGHARPLELEMVTNSILGQCLFYKHAQPAAVRLRRILQPESSPAERPAENLDALARHITEFSLHGLSTDLSIDVPTGTSGDPS
jgi:AcrR family transcriptional regulator